MRLTALDEASIQAIGHAFGYYDYGKETGMGAACSSPDKTALYICGFVRAMLAAGLLYTTIAHRYEPEMLIFGDVFVLTYKTAEV